MSSLVLKMDLSRAIKRPIRRIEFIRSKIVKIEQDLRICKAVLEIDCEDIEMLRQYNELIDDMDKTMLRLIELVK